MSQPQTATLDGLTVRLYRGVDQRLVVEIDSSGLEDKDTFAFGVPNIRVWINEQKIEINAVGELIEEAS